MQHHAYHISRHVHREWPGALLGAVVLCVMAVGMLALMALVAIKEEWRR